MGDRTGAYRVLVGKSEGKKHLENLDVDGRMFKWNLKKQDGRRGLH
jgi:hypothetical protein